MGRKDRKIQNKQQKHEKTTEESGKDYLTPMDFINLIKVDSEMANEFCYLNKVSNPYDYRIVEFNQRNLNDYMTISANVRLTLLDYTLSRVSPTSKATRSL